MKIDLYNHVMPVRYLEMMQQHSKEGIHVKRDSKVSVVYAEGLNSATSSVILQSTDRHGIVGEKPPDFQVSV